MIMKVHWDVGKQIRLVYVRSASGDGRSGKFGTLHIPWCAPVSALTGLEQHGLFFLHPSEECSGGSLNLSEPFDWLLEGFDDWSRH